MRPALIWMAATAVLAAGCGKMPLKGGSQIADGVYWRLNSLGEGERLPTDSDSVFARIRVARPGAAPGSMFSTEQWYAMGNANGTALFFGRLHQGDSATALLPAARLPWKALGAAPPGTGADTGLVTVEFSLAMIRSHAESRALERAALMERDQADESKILDTFFARSNKPWKPLMGIWYVLDTASARGPRIQSGDQVALAYTASFLDNGKVFDRQLRPDGGLSFRLGDKDQVIKGLEIAAHLLPRKGGKGLFVFPAELAFGPKGSSSGIVPPWTPVLYEVEAFAAVPGVPADSAR